MSKCNSEDQQWLQCDANEQILSRSNSTLDHLFECGCYVMPICFTSYNPGLQYLNIATMTECARLLTETV